MDDAPCRTSADSRNDTRAFAAASLASQSAIFEPPRTPNLESSFNGVVGEGLLMPGLARSNLRLRSRASALSRFIRSISRVTSSS